MKVSVIMAAYNAEQYIEAAVESILCQTFSDFELIIVDDGSTDSTPVIIDRFSDPRIKTVHQSNRGCTSARHRAIAVSGSDYIAIMDADDIALPHRLEKTVRYLDDNPDTVLLGTGYIVRDEITKSEKVIIPPTENHNLRRCLLKCDPFKDPTLLIRKSAFLASGGYRVDHGFDYELYARIAKFGKLANINDVLLITRQHENQFFRMGKSAEEHRKRRLKIRWLTLWRLKPPFFLFVKTLTWLAFEFIVNLIPTGVRQLVPNRFRDYVKAAVPPKV